MDLLHMYLFMAVFCVLLNLLF